MLGILTEKPSAAKAFAKALNGMKGTFDGTDYVIVNAYGHMYEFAKPDKQVSADLEKVYKSWDINNLPWDETKISWKRAKKSAKGINEALKKIKDTLSKCDEIAIATDVDPTGEGELLAWEILSELKLKPKRYSRFYFFDESVKEIQKAFRRRKELPSMEGDPDYQKAYYRSRWDFLSMQWTRIATSYANGDVLRQGRLKSAMVSIVGDGIYALKNYKKIPFYENRFMDENKIVYSSEREDRFANPDDVPSLYGNARVLVDSKEHKRKAPPKLLDLASLSAILEQKGFKAKEVLETYQKMYEDQVVSYPRTEDKFISPEQFNGLLPLVDKIADVIGVNKALLNQRIPRKTHVKTGGAHGANRPGQNVPTSLSSLEKYGKSAREIYSILARNYLATLAPDYEYEQQKGHLMEYPDFKGTVNIPVNMGYKLIFSDSDEENESKLPFGSIASPFIYEGFPPKPPVPTMKWLMKQLEKYDVGTGATRTGTYSDITETKYKYPLLVAYKGKLSMTEYGEKSYVLLKDTHIGSVAITEKLMADMRDIAAGILNPKEALKEVKKLVLEDMETMRINSKMLNN